MLWGLIVSLFVGAVSGCIAGYIMKSNNGLLFNIILGIVGGFVGGLIFNVLGLGGATNILGSIIVSVIGACILIFVVRLIKKKK